MNLRVTISGEVKLHEERNRSESEPEEGEIVSSGDKAHFVRLVYDGRRETK